MIEFPVLAITAVPMPPIDVAYLFPEMTRHLLMLLRSLTRDEWNLPTVSSRRTVKDIVSHLVDGSLRRLSMQRDDYRSADRGSQPQPNESLMDFLHRLNDEWETGTRRLSPRVLSDLVEWSDAQLARHFQSLDPNGVAIFPVAWAGENQSANWMDIARDYTEKWHHTQQIFDATDRPSTIMTKKLGCPCYEIFMRALPFTFRTVQAAPETMVEVAITGDAGGKWHILRTLEGWLQVKESHHSPTARVVMDQAIAWKILTKRRPQDQARREFPQVTIEGDQALGGNVLTMVSVMA